MGPYKKLWFTLIGVLIVTFSLLGYYGAEVYRQAPPIPEQVTTARADAAAHRELRGQIEATLSYAQLHQRTQAYAAHLQTSLCDVPSGARIGTITAGPPRITLT